MENKMIVIPLSGISSDGFIVKVIINDKEVFSEDYHYGYTASYDRAQAEYSKRDHENALKYNWNFPEIYHSVKPYTSDILSELCQKYKLTVNDIEVIAGNNIFTGEKVSKETIENFKTKYLPEVNC